MPFSPTLAPLANWPAGFPVHPAGGIHREGTSTSAVGPFGETWVADASVEPLIEVAGRADPGLNLDLPCSWT
jgi:hypothetical protein